MSEALREAREYRDPTCPICEGEGCQCSQGEEINEGFKSDAQRRAAFASGYKAKGKKKKKEEVEEPIEIEEKFTSAQIKQAYGILNDPRYKQGNYSGAVSAIEKLAKGLSKHPDVANALRRANEGFASAAQRRAAFASGYKAKGKKKKKEETELEEARYYIDGRTSYKGVSGFDGFEMVIDAPNESAAEDKAIEELQKARSRGKVGPRGGGAIEYPEVDTIERTNKSLMAPQTYDENEYNPSKDIEEDMDRQPQDKDVKKVKGTQPKKYYKTLPKDMKKKRAAFFSKQKYKKSDDDDDYKPAPGDAGAKTKKSIHTKKFKQMYGEVRDLNEKIKGLENKAKKTGMPYGILKKVYDRGMAAWKGGHRPGTTQQQWAFARVNSFVTKSSGTWGGADKDLAKKVRAAKK